MVDRLFRGTLAGVRRQQDADRRTAVGALLDREAAVEDRCPLADRVERGRAPLAGAVVGDDRLDLALLGVADHDRDLRRRPTSHGLVERLADDLVEPDLLLLPEALRPC